MNLRIGQGVDVHAFAEGRPLILGGIEIPNAVGLLGHSDADVLLHSVTDAVLGALAWGDIGQWFPNTDERWKGADSKELLREVWKKATVEGWSLVNCDVNVIAEKPKLLPFVPAMRTSIAGLFGVKTDCVSVKATTSERLGFVGREEGIFSTAVVLLSQD